VAFTHTTAKAIDVPAVLASGSGTRLGVPLTTGEPTNLGNRWFGGTYRIAGTLKYEASPDDQPIRRKLIVFAEPQMNRVDSTWSDGANGAYAFTYLSGDYRYTVIALDYEHNYRAVVADNITPEAMP